MLLPNSDIQVHLIIIANIHYPCKFWSLIPKFGVIKQNVFFTHKEKPQSLGTIII